MKKKFYNDRLQVMLPDSLSKALTAAANEFGITESEITREALRQYLKSKVDRL